MLMFLEYNRELVSYLMNVRMLDVVLIDFFKGFDIFKMLMAIIIIDSDINKGKKELS